MDGLIIRPYDPELDDIQEITEIVNKAYSSLAALGLRFVATYQDATITKSRIEEGTLLVGYEGGRLAGVIMYLNPSQSSGSPHYDKPGVAKFGMFGVRPELKGKGYGKALYNAVEQLAINDGAEELALDTAAPATHLRSMYEAWGYRFIEYVQWDLTQVNYQSVIMSKRLAEA